MTVRLACALLAVSLLAGCETIGSMFEEDEVSLDDRSAREIYDQAEALMADEQYRGGGQDL